MDSLFRISMLQKHVLRRWVRNTVHAWRLGCEGSEMPLAAEDPMLALWLWGAQHPSSESKGGAQARQQVWTASSPPMFTSVAMAGKWVSVWMWGPRHCFRFSSSQSPGPRGPATSKTRGGGGEFMLISQQVVAHDWRLLDVASCQPWSKRRKASMGEQASSAQVKSKSGCHTGLCQTP